MKKLGAMILVLALVLALVPMTALATNNPGGTSNPSSTNPLGLGAVSGSKNLNLWYVGTLDTNRPYDYELYINSGDLTNDTITFSFPMPAGTGVTADFATGTPSMITINQTNNTTPSATVKLESAFATYPVNNDNVTITIANASEATLNQTFKVRIMRSAKVTIDLFPGGAGSDAWMGLAAKRDTSVPRLNQSKDAVKLVSGSKSYAFDDGDILMFAINSATSPATLNWGGLKVQLFEKADEAKYGGFVFKGIPAGGSSSDEVIWDYDTAKALNYDLYIATTALVETGVYTPNVILDSHLYYNYGGYYGGFQGTTGPSMTASTGTYTGGNLYFSTSGMFGQFRSLTAGGVTLNNGTDYTVENRGGYAYITVFESALAGLSGNVRFTAAFSDGSASAYVTMGYYVPDEIVLDPPKTGDAASLMGLGFVLLALAAAFVARRARA